MKRLERLKKAWRVSKEWAAQDSAEIELWKDDAQAPLPTEPSHEERNPEPSSGA